MVKRIRLGLIFGIDSAWIAGSYYLMNLVRALNTLLDEQKPFILFLSTEQNNKIIKKLNYPYFRIKNPYKTKRNYIEAVFNKLYKIVFHKDVIIKQILNKDVDILYPANFENIYKQITNKIFWIPDFQHHYYPEFFTEKEINERNTYFSKIAQNISNLLVLSSESAASDFKKFYPEAKIKVMVVPFAVTHPDFSNLNKEVIFKKYSINIPYYIVTNQFWQHKNHILVLKALKIIRDKGIKFNFKIVFTGKADDYRAPHFFKTLIKYITDNNLETYINFVGFIDRKEQLLLMQQAIAVVQPSLFEGWSTVVEDAKAMNQFILLSDIEVHKEQIQENVHFFNPKNEKELALLLLKYGKEKPKRKNIDYSEKINLFGKNFSELLSEFF